MKKKAVPKKHGEFVKLALLDAQNRWPDNSKWYQRDVGLFKTLYGAMIKIGVKGQADIYGYVSYGDNSCLWVEIEVKLPHDKLSKYQKTWRTIVGNMRGFHIELRELSDLDKIDEEIKRRLSLAKI